MQGDGVKRICDGCGKDCHGLFQVNNGAGHGVGLFGPCCVGWAQAEQYLDSWRRGQIILSDHNLALYLKWLEEKPIKFPAELSKQG
jgi:hypothetical protein